MHRPHLRFLPSFLGASIPDGWDNSSRQPSTNDEYNQSHNYVLRNDISHVYDYFELPTTLGGSWHNSRSSFSQVPQSCASHLLPQVWSTLSPVVYCIPLAIMLFSVLLFVSLVTAQTYSACNPLTQGKSLSFRSWLC